MASTLRFRTPHIEELPTTQSRQAPGFTWVAVSGPATSEDPSKTWGGGAGGSKAKRSRASLQGPTDAQREALSSRQQREIEKRIRDLNSDSSKEVQVAIPKSSGAGAGGGGGAARAGKTANTKKILASGKTFAHYLDDEEAEIARTGKRDGDLEVGAPLEPDELREDDEAEEDGDVPGKSLLFLLAYKIGFAMNLDFRVLRSSPPFVIMKTSISREKKHPLTEIAKVFQKPNSRPY